MSKVRHSRLFCSSRATVPKIPSECSHRSTSPRGLERPAVWLLTLSASSSWYQCSEGRLLVLAVRVGGRTCSYPEDQAAVPKHYLGGDKFDRGIQPSR